MQHFPPALFLKIWIRHRTLGSRVKHPRANVSPTAPVHGYSSAVRENPRASWCVTASIAGAGREACSALPPFRARRGERHTIRPWEKLLTFHFCPECGSTLFWAGVHTAAHRRRHRCSRRPLFPQLFPQPERSTTNTPGLALQATSVPSKLCRHRAARGAAALKAGSRESRTVRRSAAEKELCNKTIIIPYENSDTIPVTRSLGRSAAGEGRTIRGRSGSGASLGHDPAAGSAG